jgi:RHS repeat-associated protein
MWTWFSDPFGTTAANSNPAGAGTFVYNLRFPGQVYDPQAGLQQNWNRDYDPTIGRYVEPDPISIVPGLGASSLEVGAVWPYMTNVHSSQFSQLNFLYPYAKSNPLGRKDRIGLQDEAPSDTTGAGEQSQAACDAEDNRKEAEENAANARAKGDPAAYSREMNRALYWLMQYYTNVGTPLNSTDYGQ